MKSMKQITKLATLILPILMLSACLKPPIEGRAETYARRAERSV